MASRGWSSLRQFFTETPHTEFTTSDQIFVINLTISYNIQYNVSIVSSLCGVTTTKELNYGKHNGYTRNNNVIVSWLWSTTGRQKCHARLHFYSAWRVLTCENDTFRSTDEEIVSTTCHSSGNWIPDSTQFIYLFTIYRCTYWLILLFISVNPSIRYWLSLIYCFLQWPPTRIVRRHRTGRETTL